MEVLKLQRQRNLAASVFFDPTGGGTHAVGQRRSCGAPLGFLFAGFWWTLNQEFTFKVEDWHFKLGIELLLVAMVMLGLFGVVLPLRATTLLTVLVSLPNGSSCEIGGSSHPKSGEVRSCHLPSSCH